ncbi:hypothetical protein [Algibacter sp. 2305UL17-15]|uniref:hypothetical protein n=1 Tax=Algibacter sp. 2305UL17-15 TaxID=3231268 RepID=UPI0034588F8E
MKTKQVPTRLIVFLLCLSMSSMYAQVANINNAEKYNKELEEAFKYMVKNAKLLTLNSGKECKIQEIVDRLDVPSYMYANIPFLTHSSLTLATNFEADLNYIKEDTFNKGNFKTISEKSLNAFSNANNFSDYVKGLTGKDIGDIKGEHIFARIDENGNDIDPSIKDIDTLKRIYDFYKRLFNSEHIIEKQTPFTSNGCWVYPISKIKIEKIDYPNITYTIKTEGRLDCECEFLGENRTLRKGTFEYKATVTGLYTHSKTSINLPKNPTLTITSIDCCPKKEEPTETALADDGIQDVMPDQSIGGGAGFGATQDFEDISYCVFAEYLKRINYGSDNGLYWGLEGSYSNLSFNDASSNRFNIGTKLQYHIPATPSQQTQFVAGIMGSYNFGTNDNGFSKDDVSGIIACVYGGINIRVCEDWSFFCQFPVFIYETFTFKPESGGEFKTDGTSLLLNKDNPVKLGLRYHF